MFKTFNLKVWKLTLKKRLFLRKKFLYTLILWNKLFKTITIGWKWYKIYVQLCKSLN